MPFYKKCIYFNILQQHECIQVRPYPNIQDNNRKSNGKIMLQERLKIARDSTGKSQKEMAEALGIGLKSWQVYEQGSSVPGGSVFESLVKMGFNANWLLTGEGKMKRDPVEYPMGETLENGDILSDAAQAAVKVVPAAGPPRINGVYPVNIEDKPFAWFHEWIDEELKGKSITEIMRFAVKIKAELDKEREG